MPTATMAAPGPIKIRADGVRITPVIPGHARGAAGASGLSPTTAGEAIPGRLPEQAFTSPTPIT
ncbi:hypothetical protein [Geminicoccus roseus]|uniref:hypothetical protein n=1 Tax=Geminicoccus roseus TaxID=404900 RepID=UPI000480DB99|nr:hypothetical protein [Geminicoccus roseus]